jgi:TolA-binding protein
MNSNNKTLIVSLIVVLVVIVGFPVACLTTCAGLSVVGQQQMEEDQKRWERERQERKDQLEDDLSKLEQSSQELKGILENNQTH